MQPIHSLLTLGYAKLATVKAVMQLVEAFSEVLTIWKDQSVTMPPKGLHLLALALLCSSQLFKPVTVFLIHIEHLLLEVLSKASAVQQQCQGSEANLG
jgi:Mg2+/Co2+ transporter CorB